MLFNSLLYALFFAAVFILYWLVANKNLKLQNILLLAASYFFYASWDYRFLLLLIFSTFLNFFTGLKIHQADHPHERKLWLWLTVIINLSVLGVFKYYNFFAESFAAAMTHAGFAVSPWTFNILLPLGISFYTFHGLSYVFDIYRNKIKPTHDFIDYGVFVGFFPLLIAGPIERAAHLLPQIQRPRTFDYNQTVDGLRQILWGLFKKIVIADNCGTHVNAIFENPEAYSSSTLLWGAILFSFQIYGDFSGYSDIATGSARMLGFDLLRNFAYPYFSRDMAEFWRRWHMSLNTWLRDYLYIPLGGSKGSRWKVSRNIFIIFLASGLWHGANWTFLVWGFIHALFFLPLLLTGRHRKHLDTVAAGKFWPSGLSSHKWPARLYW
jgi:alginate O-acetyltransferase complex protein AlgI